MWSQKEVEKVERKMLTKAVNIPLKAKKVSQSSNCKNEILIWIP